MQLFRILLLVVGVFGTGIVTGRLTAPPASAPAVLEATGRQGRTITPRVITGYFHQKLTLTKEQQQSFAAIARELLSEISGTEPVTAKRYDAIKRCYPRWRALLRPDQLAAYDQLVTMHQARMDELLQEKK